MTLCVTRPVPVPVHVSLSDPMPVPVTVAVLVVEEAEALLALHEKPATVLAAHLRLRLPMSAGLSSSCQGPARRLRPLQPHRQCASLVM
jgi:hypothetical protein